MLRSLGQDLGFVPFTIGTCGILYLLSLATTAASGGTLLGGGLFNMLSPNTPSLFVFGASGAVPVFGLDRWWTVLSAGWLHGSALHILFNMMWVRQLAPPVADLYGPGRMIIIYTAASVAGFALSSYAGAYLPGFVFLRGGQFTVGASAAIFGLLGALIHYGRKGSSAVSRQAWMYALFLFVFGIFMRGVDNWAHLGGFVGGYAMAAFLNPMKPERGDHLLAALVCLLLSFASIVVSFVTGLGLFRASL